MFGSCECGYDDCGICGPHIEANKKLDVKLKAKKPRGPFWTTKQGVKMAIRDMETSHILNCLKHLERRTVQVKAELPYPTFNGEMAQMCAEQDWEAAQGADVREVFPVYTQLEEELERRQKRLAKQNKPKLVTGAKVILKIDGKPIAFANDVSYSLGKKKKPRS